MLRLNFLLFLCFGILQSITAQVNVDVNFDLKHRVGSKETFDREKFIVLHAGATENDYNNELGKLDTLMNLYDAYYGRETGRMRFVGDQVSEDPNRMGFADSTSIAAQGTSLNANYAANTAKHPYEKGNLITAAQDVPFYPNGNNPTKQGWFFSSNDTPSEPFGSATGQFMGLFTRDLYGTGGVNGPPRPTYVEVMNEPVWPLVDEGMHGGGTIQDIFNMHLTVADSVKRYNPGIKVGGYTTAFPEFEKFGMQPNGDTLFGQWEERWQKFIDEVGPKMDFYSVHLYDFPSIGGKEILRKGGNIEATFDMIEHYNTLVYGNVKPWVISEYGSQLNDYYAQNWSPFRDWQILKAFSSMMIQFMERPDVIEKTIPFVLTQADFSFGNPVAGFPYPWRMMRRANEPSAYTGDWVFTEVIKFYELWSDVKGTRVDTKSTDPDLMVDAYVDQANNKAYLILNNIDERNFSVNLNEFGLGSTNITNVKIKHLYLGSD
ncbi:MAG: beta-agarase, partial [Bacteroidota bacterium]